MSAVSKAADIAGRIAERLGGITVAGGFQTDVGTTVLRGRRNISEEDVPCTLLVEGEDTNSDQRMGKARIAQRYIMEGYSECDPDHPNDTGHAIVADFKRAIFTEADDPMLGPLGFPAGYVSDVRYIGRSITPRDAGVSQVAAAVEIEVSYVEELANP